MSKSAVKSLNKLGNKKRLFLIITIFYIIYTVFPLFSDFAGIPVVLPSLLTFFSIIILFPNAFNTKIFGWFLIYAFVMMIYVFIGKPLTIGIGSVEDTKKIFIDFAFVLPSMAIYVVLLYLDDIRLYKWIALSSITLLLISFLYIIPLLNVSNNILKEDVTNEDIIRLPGLPSYGLMHAYTLLIPALCYAFRYTTGKTKMILFVFLAIYLYMITKTAVTTSMMIMIFVVLISLFYSEKNIPAVFVILFILAVFIYFFYLAGGFVYLIDLIMPYFDGTDVVDKLDDFKYSMEVGHVTGSTITVRKDLHAQSWDCFWQNPLFGTPNVGGHSNFIDRLGGMGLFGSIPYFMLFYSFYENIRKSRHISRVKFFLYMTLLSALVFLYQKGNWNDADWLFLLVIAPSVLFFFEYGMMSKSGKKYVKTNNSRGSGQEQSIGYL